MNKTRLEMFSDGVIAIIITIMVIELHPPTETSLTALREVLPTFLSYLLSFTYLAVYWNNHHHMLQGVKSVNGKILWANFHLLFWMSLIPFVTGWLGKGYGSKWPTAIYGTVLLLTVIAFTLLFEAIHRHHRNDPVFAKAKESNSKVKVSFALHILAIAASFIQPWATYAILVIIVALWFFPDRRIEEMLSSTTGSSAH